MLNGIGGTGLVMLQHLQPLSRPANDAIDPSGRGGDSRNVSFGATLERAIAHVDGLLDKADRVTGDLALGKDVELHDVTIATEQAELALQFTIAVRNKLVEAYQEIMRMQV